ncbi:WYL domain-containing protein [Paraglaciecola sp.]|uniref:helix-turn-helix transcriptional regulator n=4 Tax=Paraglaciecola sp. TaxID=1920173 RepID=UPI003264423A
MNIRRRHDFIIRSLRRSGTSTVGELASKVGVSKRTILRDISELRDQGFLIDSESGRGGGLQISSQSIQASSRISVIEIFALIISVVSMRAAGTLPFSDFANSGLAKIEKTLPTDKMRDLRRLLDCLYIGQLSSQVDTSDMGMIDLTLLPAFEIAFLEMRLLNFQYRDVKGVTTNRTIEPQAMLILPPLWYLVAWDPTRRDFRHFRMDRISKPEYIETTFRRRYVPFESHVSPIRDLSR